MAKGDNKVDQVLDIIKEMTILELRDLNTKIQDEFGITAAAPVAMAAAPAALRRPVATALLRRRPRRRSPSSTSSSRTPARTRSTSSRRCARSRRWA